MIVDIRVEREGDEARLVPTGSFELANVTLAAQALEIAQARLAECVSVDIDLAELDRVDGAGAVLLARFFDRLDADGCHTRIIEGPKREATRLIARYRECRRPPQHARLAS